ncbi:MAG: HAD family phosphatase [Anaerolinea sp.]|nr:HAD family phosphatase [Anaerolinea sp.]
MLKLAVFDLDGTLKAERDPYIYLHRRLGTLEAAEAFTAQGLSGEIPYEEWLRLDTGLWTGQPRRLLRRHLAENPYLPGAVGTVAALRAAGVTVAIISSGLLLHAEMVAEELGIGPVLANEMGFDGVGEEARVNGHVRAHVPYGDKQTVLTRLQEELGVTPAETLAAGDTRSDLGLFRRAAVAVAVQPDHPDVARAAHIVLADGDLRPLLGRLHQVAPSLWSA